MEAVPWEYRLARFTNPEIGRLQNELAGYGRAGWELVTSTSTIQKFGVVNDLVAVFKRPGSSEVDRAAEPKTEGTDGWI